MVYEFMILLITVTLLGSIVVTNSVNEDADSENHHARDVKEHWRLVFGSKADIFASSVTLNLAIDDVSAGAERLADKIDPSQRERVERYVNVMGGQEHISYARQLGCLSYDVGLELLRNQTADGVPPSLRAVPFVVNKARNAICVHFTKVPSEFKKSFLFHYSIPIALTIDKQLYSVVDNMFFKNDTLQQAMGASPEKRTIFLVVYPYRDDPSGASEHRIRHIVESLSSYSQEVFDSFFWTSKNISDNLQSMRSQRRLVGEHDSAKIPDTLEVDSTRHATWSALFTHLSEHLLSDSVDSSTTPKKYKIPRELQTQTSRLSRVQGDPCHFKRMTAEMKVYGDKITFPVDYLQAYRDEKLAASCLAFLSSRLAMPTLFDAGHKGTDVFHISLEYGPSLYNNRARSIPQSKTSASSTDSMPYFVAGLRGSGQVVGVADTGIDRSHCFFSDSVNGDVPANPVPSREFDLKYRKVVQYNYIQNQGDKTDTTSGHGTHVCGTVAGNAEGGDGTYNGAAPDAKLAFLDMTSSSDGGLGVPETAADLYEPSYAAGARIHSNSWGSNHDGRGYYTNSDSDGWLYKNQEFLAIYAAGNNGGKSAYLISQEAQGKNCFAVGAGESPSSIASFSSIGPAYDNRFKPDLILPGSGTISAEAEASSGEGGDNGGWYNDANKIPWDRSSSSCATGGKSGTSMACPAASGNAALIRDYLENKWAAICEKVIGMEAPGRSQFCVSVTSPSGPLVKALMLHSGETMASYAGGQSLGYTPDSKQGYGIMYLGNVLPLPQESLDFGLYFEDCTGSSAISSGESVKYLIKVPTKTTPLRVTLSWYDPPNQNGIDTAALLHDLDLMVTAPSGEAYWGNHRSEAGNKVDRLNNNEQVLVISPEAGTWEILVTANALVQGDLQAYALVATFTTGGYGTRGDAEGSVPDPAPAPTPTLGPAPETTQPSISSPISPTLAPTSSEDNDNDDGKSPPKNADDDHYHHKHPGNDDWHSHKRGEDDYIPPGKKFDEQYIAPLSPFEMRMIRAMRGVFAPGRG